MKIVILEASHWHVPLYLDALGDHGIEVVGVSDAAGGPGPAIANRFGARFYERYESMLDNEQPDFAFAFGRHCDMKAIATTLIDRKIPLALEKPCGMNGVEVSELRQLADAQNAFVSIPLIFGFSDLPAALTKDVPSSPWRHMAFRFIAGPIERYLDANCPWMLARDLAGGGCAINLGVHFVDLVLRLTGQDVSSISARMTHAPDKADVEIYSSMTLETQGGQIATIETGYTYPGGTPELRDFTFALASDDAYYRSRPEGVTRTPRDGSPARQIDIELNTDIFYSAFVRDTLQAFRAGRKPHAGLDRMERIINVIDCAYKSDEQGGTAVRVRDREARNGITAPGAG